MRTSCCMSQVRDNRVSVTDSPRGLLVKALPVDGPAAGRGAEAGETERVQFMIPLDMDEWDSMVVSAVVRRAWATRNDRQYVPHRV